MGRPSDLADAAYTRVSLENVSTTCMRHKLWLLIARCHQVKQKNKVACFKVHTSLFAQIGELSPTGRPAQLAMTASDSVMLITDSNSFLQNGIFQYKDHWKCLLYIHT